MSKVRSLVALVAVVGGLALGGDVGCASTSTPPPVPPNVGPVINGGLTAIACGFNVYATDTSKVPPASWEQVALDIATTCGMDVADIVNLFGASHPVSVAANATSSAVHAAAVAFKAKK